MIICGDALKVLAYQLDEELDHPANGPARQVVAPHSIHAVITDPPYGLRLMAQKWDGDSALERIDRLKRDRADD